MKSVALWEKHTQERIEHRENGPLLTALTETGCRSKVRTPPCSQGWGQRSRVRHVPEAVSPLYGIFQGRFSQTEETGAQSQSFNLTQTLQVPFKYTPSFQKKMIDRQRAFLIGTKSVGCFPANFFLFQASGCQRWLQFPISLISVRQQWHFMLIPSLTRTLFIIATRAGLMICVRFNIHETALTATWTATDGGCLTAGHERRSAERATSQVSRCALHACTPDKWAVKIANYIYVSQ